MKAGVRALGVAESYASDAERSVLCSAVVRADRAVDGFGFGSCTVGGLDATDAVSDLVSGLEREDVRYLLLAGVAPAWFNLLDLSRLCEAVERPAITVSFEPSQGLEPALTEQFDGAALERRLAIYRSLPDRERLAVNDEVVYVRAVGVDAEAAANVVRAFTPSGGRPEPLRVARLAARAARRFADY